MASNILGSDPYQTSRQLRAGKEEVGNREEVPVTFGTRAGSPSKFIDPRFNGEGRRYAGAALEDHFRGNGVQGPFAVALRENQAARQGTEEWMFQLMNGLHSPFDGGMA